MAGDLLFVSNRLPFIVDNAKGVIQTGLSSRDLVTALSGIVKPTDIRWFGWLGINVQDADERKYISNALASNNAIGIFLDEQLAHGYYHRLSNSILWSVLHFQSDVDFDQNAWNSYIRVNEIFAESIASEAKGGSLIWVHDYHLMLLPRLLQARLSEQGKRCAIGFTLHTPFPIEDFWKAIPVKKELLEGILASDVVGFHTDEYKRNFTKSCASILGAYTKSAGQIDYNGHQCFVKTFLLGVDPQKFNDSVLDFYVQERIRDLEARYKDTIVIVGIDRLDHTKRMTQKLEGYGYFLDTHPQLKGKVTLVQAAIPNQDGGGDYQELETDIGNLSTKINEKHGTITWTPLIYVHHSFSFTELTALLCISDICFMASRRGGMSLVASEYVACQENKHGVLVLSETSGAESFVDAGSITFNPSKAPDISNAIHRAVIMSEEEKEERYGYLRHFVTTQTSAKWARDFICALSGRVQCVD